MSRKPLISTCQGNSAPVATTDAKGAERLGGGLVDTGRVLVTPRVAALIGEDEDIRDNPFHHMMTSNRGTL
jgi:hypothetical protein